jgi:hypothetical protein
MPPKPNARRRGATTAVPAVEDSEKATGAGRQVHAKPGNPNPYPHRLSVDVDHDTYRTLRLIAAGEGCRLIDVVRDAIAREIERRR